MSLNPPITKIFDVFDVHRLIIQYLSLQELRTYGLVSLDTHDVVRSLLRPSNNIDLILRRFFPEDRVPYFRRVQRATGTLIGGSTALQFFIRESYPRSDLDLYVNRLHVEDLITALELGISCRKVLSRQGRESEEADYQYLSCGVEDVQDLVTPTGRVVQVVTTHGAPVQSILRYHSTTVMNLISASHGYSLYGRETLELFLSLYTRAGGDITAVRKKYEGRGWQTYEYDGGALSEADLHKFVDMDRAVNDEQTWIIKLNSPPLYNLDSRELALRLEGWALGYRPLGEAFIYAAPPADHPH